MDKLLEFINSKTDNKYLDLKVSNLTYNRQDNVFTCRFVYKKDRPTIEEEERKQLCELIKDYINLNLTVDVKTKKALIDEDVVKEFVYRFITNNYISIAEGITKNNILVKILGNNVTIEVSLSLTVYNIIKNKGIEQELLNELNLNFFENFAVEFKPVAVETDFSLNDHIEKVSSLIYDVEVTPEYVEVNNVTSFIGEVITDKPILFETIKNAVVGIAIAGNIVNITKKSFVSKKKNENGENILKDYFSFNLQYNNKFFSCVYFINERDIEKFETLQENSQVVIFGDVEKFNDKLNFKVKRISLCQIELPKEKVVEEKTENEHYIYVKPEPYVMVEQPNLFDFETKKVNEFLQNNTVVVFDLETTGLEPTVNEIIEIGAVKIVNGKITETFSTLVKPKAEISEEITNLTGITNEMVANAYTIEQVIPDFYKFTRGSVLTAYNISFDYNFLYVIANKLGYNFNNKQIDSMYLAKTKLRGLKNFRLKTVATALGVPLENAHRAINDAIATAEVFIILSEDLK